jgi:hypothetical protein
MNWANLVAVCAACPAFEQISELINAHYTLNAPGIRRQLHVQTLSLLVGYQVSLLGLFTKSPYQVSLPRSGRLKAAQARRYQSMAM